MSNRATPEQLRQQIQNLELAMEELQDRADADQRIIHTKWVAEHWLAALDPLEVQLIKSRALLKRIETVGR